VAVWAVFWWGVALGEESSISAEQILQRMTEAADTLRDYRCRFVKWERIEGVLREETMRYFFKAVYRNGKMWARRGGMLKWLTLKLDPHSDLAKGESRHAIDESDLPDVIRRMRTNIACVRGVLSVSNIERNGDRTVYEVQFLSRDELGKGYSYRAKLCIDFDLGLPIRAEYYDWEDRLFERFLYEDLEVNVGIEEERFKL
jgi:outer membrane lipoprotein-sorting protein